MENTQEKKNGKGKRYKKSTNNKIIGIIEYAIIFAIAICIISIMYQFIKNPNKTPNVLGNKFYVIASGSMEPEISIGDVAIINNKEKAKTGKVVAYRDNKTIIVHRVIEEVEESGVTKYKTKGDSNNAADIKLVNEQQIEGTCTLIIPYIGYIIIFIYNCWFYVIALIIIAILIIKLIKVIKRKD